MQTYIAVDWGSTHLRAWHIEHGQCINTLNLPCGVTQIAPGEAPDVFTRHIAPWRKGSALPVVMAGMIGSDAGWRAVDYLPCPLSLNHLGERLCELADNVWIVPGLKQDLDGEYNVMRGEETQLRGAVQLAPAHCYVMPGTHSKWVSVEDGQVTRFDTAMTGELHHVLMQHSLIGKGLPNQVRDDAAFRHGLETGMTTPSLVNRLFATRAAWVLGALAKTSVNDALSGLLIGAEVATLSRQYQPQQVTLVASEVLTPLYRQAFACLNITVVECAAQTAFLEGIRRINDARY
ncbi:2-dehydro-3-deoxygalactonokinase [Pseudescherichia vulneris]